MGNKKYIDVVLFHATWCGYCTEMKPEWDKFKENISKMKNKHDGIKINVEEYEHSKLEKIGGGKINNVEIAGYPTIKIKLSNGKDEKEYDYDKYGKKKDSEYMIKFIQNVCEGLAKL